MPLACPASAPAVPAPGRNDAGRARGGGEMIWRDQIILDLEDGPLILYTFYGYNNKKFRETLDYLFDTFKYLRNPHDCAMGAIRSHGEWIDKNEAKYE